MNDGSVALFCSPQNAVAPPIGSVPTITFTYIYIYIYTVTDFVILQHKPVGGEQIACRYPVVDAQLAAAPLEEEQFHCF